MTHSRRAGAIALQACLLLALFAFGGEAFAAGPEAGGDGHEKFELSKPFLPTIAWTAICFGAALLLLRKLAWGRILTALDERETKIRESLEAADRMRAEQEKFQAEQEQLLAAARKEANEIVAEGKRDAEAVKEKIVSDARIAAEDTQRKAIAEIDRAKDNAVIEIHQRAVDLSVAIAEKLVGRAVSVEDQEALVQQTIEQYKNN